jgi:TldD protein
MHSELPIDKIIQTAMRYGADFAEVFVEQTRGTHIALDDRRLESASVSFDFGIGIRVLSDDRTAYGSTNDLTKKNLLALAKRIGQAVHAKTKDTKSIVLTEKLNDSPATVSMHPYGITLEKKCDVVQRANDVAWGVGKQIRQVRMQYRDFVRRVLVASSEGVFTSDEQVGTLLFAQVIASENGVLQTGQESMGGSAGFEVFDETSPEEIAEKAARRAVKMLSAELAPAGRMPVIISAEAGGTMIHEAVGHGLEADLTCEGNSVYSGKIGDAVASSLITVIDDATLAGKRGSFTFDDEGSPAQRTILIENGVLRSYMSDRLRARKMNCTSSGNARRQSYEYPPLVRMTNTLIASGKHDPAEILRDTKHGLFVKRMGGGQVNTINGDFVFDVQEGYIIENGKISHPVRGATLIGNGPKILAAIDRVGSDLGFSIGTCGKEGQDSPVSCGQPTIRIPEIVVGGRK